jgi:hypothetical protein
VAIMVERVIAGFLVDIWLGSLAWNVPLLSLSYACAAAVRIRIALGLAPDRRLPSR